MPERRPDRLPRLLLVTGMSGAGKSTVLDALEDMGWDVVDNLPADLLEPFVNPAGECRTADVAVGMDCPQPRLRSGSICTISFTQSPMCDAEILYLDCAERRADPALR